MEAEACARIESSSRSDAGGMKLTKELIFTSFARLPSTTGSRKLAIAGLKPL